MAAVIIDEAHPQGLGFFTLESTDGHPHLLEVGPTKGTGEQPSVQSFRSWWETERPYAEAAAQALTIEEAQLQRLDRQRWQVLAAFAPGVWPLAGGSVSAMANREAAEIGNPEPPLQWDRLYVPLPGLAPAQMADASLPPAPVPGFDDTYLDPPVASLPRAPGAIWLWVLPRRGPVPAEPLPAEGLVAVPELDSSLLVRTVDGLTVNPTPMRLRPEFVRTYTRAEERPVRMWRRLARLRLEDALSAWRIHEPYATNIEVPSAGLRVVSVAGDPAETESVPRGSWLGVPVPAALLSLVAYLIAGWFIAPPATGGVDPLRRLGTILLGWLACWVVAVAGLPIYGLGFLPGGVVAVHVWEQ
ncbi:MAG TPA: hypothetical protein VEI97_02495, partial [bacterium]|nr:hypothetical protein [bacterium]